MARLSVSLYMFVSFSLRRCIWRVLKAYNSHFPSHILPKSHECFPHFPGYCLPKFSRLPNPSPCDLDRIFPCNENFPNPSPILPLQASCVCMFLSVYLLTILCVFACLCINDLYIRFNKRIVSNSCHHYVVFVVHFAVSITPFRRCCKTRAKRGWELMRVQTLTLVWHGTLKHSHRLSCALIDFERVHIFHESWWEFSLVWPEIMIVDESWRKLSWESTLISSHPRLAQA